MLVLFWLEVTIRRKLVRLSIWNDITFNSLSRQLWRRNKPVRFFLKNKICNICFIKYIAYGMPFISKSYFAKDECFCQLAKDKSRWSISKVWKLLQPCFQVQYNYSRFAIVHNYLLSKISAFVTAKIIVWPFIIYLR